MKIKSLRIALSMFAIASLTLNGCKKDPKPEPTPTVEKGKVTVNLEHKWGMSGANFSLNTDLTHPMTGDVLNYTTFKYYVSNLKLKKTDGSWWVHPESYFLVDLSQASSTKLLLDGVPVGKYTEVSYTMGVDSTRNVSGAQTGALSTTNNMFWTWNSGYIMVRAEGTYSASGSSGGFTYHLGGFQGTNNIVTVKNAAFGAELNVQKSKTVEIHMIVNPARMFHTFGSVTNGSMVHMPGANAKTLATDFYGGVNFDHIHN
jgi:hypothetical protein